ncbi:MAG: Gfo/Idh/MocA family oxidoreductase [Planctomycetota bacterium]
MKLCMIGTRGHNGYVHAGLEKLPDVQVAGVSAGTPGGDPGGLKAWCNAHGHPGEVFDDWLAMLDAAQPDLLSVAGPFELHADICVEAFRRGIHVFCEKPVATTLAELARVRAAHEAAGVHFAAMMGLRYAPAFYTAWRAVQDGAVGTVRLISTRKSYKLGERSAFFRSRTTYPGTIPWVGSHAIDWIHWFSGEAFETVRAAHSTRDNRGHGDLEVSALCHFTMTNEVFASASIDYLRPPGAPTHGDDRVRVAGTQGVVEVRGGEVFLVSGETDGERQLAAACGRQIFCDFVRHAAGEAEALIGPEETFAVTEACLLARQSADEGKPMAFPPRQRQP